MLSQYFVLVVVPRPNLGLHRVFHQTPSTCVKIHIGFTPFNIAVYANIICMVPQKTGVLALEIGGE